MTWGDDLATTLIGSCVPAGFDDCVALWETPIAPCPLITLVDLKTALGITDTSQDDELTRYINVYSQSIENYLERQLCETEREVVYVARSYCRMKKIRVPQWPIIAVTGLQIDGADIDPGGWVLDDRRGYIYPTACMGWGLNSYALLKYTSGYNPIPADLQNVMVQLCGRAVNETVGGAEMGPLKSQRVEGAVTEQYYDPRANSSSTTRASGAVDIGKYYSVLDYYRGERAFI